MGSLVCGFDPLLPEWPREGWEGSVFAVEGLEVELVVSRSGSARWCGPAGRAAWDLGPTPIPESDHPLAKEVPPATAARGV